MAPKVLRITLQLLVVRVSCLPSISPLSFKYPAVFNFGDSNSDTGGLTAGVAFPVGQPNGQTYFLKPSGRFCDGRLIIDFLAGVAFPLGQPNVDVFPTCYMFMHAVNATGLPFLNPYMDSIGAPNFQSGCNFATGGSTILPASAASISPFSFGVQVSQFVRFKARVAQLLAKDGKLRKYLPLKSSFSRGLYMFDMGQNDLDGAFNSQSEGQVVALIPTVLTEFENGIKRLYYEGARNFWVHNTGPLGCLPRNIAVFGKNSSNIDQLGCVILHNDAAKQFNELLDDLCTKLRDQLPQATITYVDIFSIKLDLISNYSQYGFKQPLAACCGYGGLPLNFDSRIDCGQTRSVNGSIVSAQACNNTTEYINWDGNHYTEAANRFVSTQILTGNLSDLLFSSNTQHLLHSKVFHPQPWDEL